ncbi:MAG: hypothetical protein PWQ97_1518, partial [Tepidanaerobacteraceae bacterium]|nr:hypothetical protein [Tepidanaerobacteraceae bacterium]
FQSPKLTEQEAKDLARNSYEAFNYLLEGGEKSSPFYMGKRNNLRYKI